MTGRDVGQTFLSESNPQVMSDILEQLNGLTYSTGIGTLMCSLAYLIESDKTLSSESKLELALIIGATIATIVSMRSEDENSVH